MRFSTMLEGSRPNLTEDEQKLILFRSFPEAWQINWNRTQVTAQEATVEKLMQYMSSEKLYADKEWKKNHKKKENKGENKGYQGRGSGRGYQGRGGRGRGRGREGRGRGQGRGNNERCRQHEGAHLWKDCPSNFNSPAGIAAGAGRGRGGGGRDGGRGRGRGGYESYHTTGRGGYESYHASGYPPPQPYYGSPVSGASLPPPPVAHVSVGPSESHYYSQRGGSYPPSVAPTQNEVYMCSDGRYYNR